MTFRRKGDKHRYSFLSSDCIGLDCFQPGLYQHRGATLAGSRNTGTDSACCMRRAYHGCPGDSDRVYQIELAKKRKLDGWKSTP